jgi:hypothetical protein
MGTVLVTVLPPTQSVALIDSGGNQDAEMSRINIRVRVIVIDNIEMQRGGVGGKKRPEKQNWRDQHLNMVEDDR